VTSDFPIREPFLNFLVEINWPRGRLIREYTVLLDPPTVTKRRPPAVATPRADVKSSPTRPVALEQAASTAVADSSTVSGEYGPVQENDTLWGIAKRVRPKGISMEQMMIALQRANSQAFIANNINSLRKGQILRVPAREEILEINRAEARQAYRQQQDEWLATRSQRMQAKEPKEPVAAETAEAAGATTDAMTVDTAESEAKARLRIATARPDGEGEAGASEDAADGVTSGDLKERLLMARENAETSRQESEVLRNQVDELQQRLEDMQKLLSLKDDQLAHLQDGVAQQKADEEKAAVEAQQEVAAEEPIEEVPQEAKAEETSTEPQQMVDVADQQLDPAEAAMIAARKALEKEQQTAEELRTAARDFLAREEMEQEAADDAVAEDAASEAEVADAEAATEQPEESPATPVPVPAATDTQLIAPETLPELETVEPPGGVELSTTPPQDTFEPAETPPRKSFIEENMLLLGGGGLGLIVLLLAILLMRRKSSAKKGETVAEAETEADESILLDIADGDEPIQAEEAASPGSDTSFLSEFSPSDINALQDDTGEVDPVSEADVYIAYGRYQQAEDLLEQALEKDPDRLSIKHKLLEVYYATRNTGTFVTFAQKMVDAGQVMADAPAWVRAKNMGRELDPSNPLFESTDGEPRPADTIKLNQPVVPQAPDEVDIDDDGLALDDLDLSALASDLSDDADELDSIATDAGADLDLSLDLDDLSREFDGSATNDGNSLEDLESFELNLPELDSEELSNDESIRTLEKTAKSDVLADTASPDTVAPDTAIPIEDPYWMGIQS